VFVTHRAATRALPPSSGLRFALCSAPSCFFPLRSSEEKNKPETARKGKQ